MQGRKPRAVTECNNISDLREVARRRLPYPVFDFLDGGAEDEMTLRENSAVFSRTKLIHRSLVDVSNVKTQTRVLGADLEWPFFCSPCGALRFYDPEGELAAARAAAKAGTMYGLSTAGSYSLEDVAAASNGPKLYQLYIYKDRDFTRQMIERCKSAGYTALCLTVDGTVPGNRERDLRNGWGIKIKLSVRSAIDFAMHPAWVGGYLSKGPITLPNIAAQTGSNKIAEQMAWLGRQLTMNLTWKDLREFIELWNGPFAIKGVLSADDARRAADAGATAVILSNHGGRQLDCDASPFEVLPEVVKAVGDRVEVILDGGVRRGTHILKALALGAKACSSGRPWVYGLGAGGEEGAFKALTMLRTELIRDMRLLGCVDTAQLDESFVRRF